MKKILVVLFALLSLNMAYGQESKQKVAVYVTGGAEAGDNDMLGAQLTDAITASQNYVAVERTADFLQQLKKEQNYQRTGNVDDDQIAKLGQQSGAKYVCVAELMAVQESNYFVTARLIEVEKASVVGTADGAEPVTDLPTLKTVSKKVADLLLKDVAKNKSGATKKRVAVYVTGASDNTGKVLGVKLVSAITKSDKYAAMERTTAFLKKLAEEHSYERSGNVADNDIAAMGRQFGVRYVCAAKVSKSSFGGNTLSVRLIDVESAEVIKSASDALTSEEFNSLVKISKKIAGELIGVDGLNIEMIPVGGFSIGKYEVTQEQWEAVMGSNPSYFKGDDLPVENVSWNDAKAFISKLNSMTGKTYRLPTEAEWERAAKGGKNYDYSGSNSIDAVAWYDGSKTHPVGTKQPNALGIYDMTGNVWEWCEDCYDSSCSDRVSRGGSWFNSAAYCRVSGRNGGTPSGRYNSLGFRLVLPN
ncbi:hypothetical protein FACS1894195_2120 [Bacteroidia bacterium]|nr:hypothetical protein FACS1894195_2120 [Bacteroidia bacterium]